MRPDAFPASWSRVVDGALPLDVAELDVSPPPFWREGLKRVLQDEAVHYHADRAGDPILRLAITRHAEQLYGATPAAVYLIDSIRRALEVLAVAISRPNDRLVVVGLPIYRPLLRGFLASGAKIEGVPWRWIGGGWAIDPKELGHILETPMRAILYNSPHNPTGASLPAALRAKVAEAAEVHGALVLTDDVYADFAANQPAEIDSQIDRARTISFGSFTKLFNLNGLRIAHIVDHNDQLRQLGLQKAFSTPSRPSEHVIETCLTHPARAAWVKDLVRRLAMNAAECAELFNANPEFRVEAAPETGSCSGDNIWNTRERFWRAKFVSALG